MKATVVAVASVLALVGIAIAAIPSLQDHVASRIEAELERDGTLQVSDVSVDFWSRGVSIVGVTAPLDGGFSADSVEITGLAWSVGELLRGRTPFDAIGWGDPLNIGHVEVANARFRDPVGGGIWTAGKLLIEGLNLPRYDAAYDGLYRSQVLTARMLAALSLRRLETTALAYASEEAGFYSIASLGIEGYGHGLVDRLALRGIESRAAKARTSVFSVKEVEADGVDLRRLLATFSSTDWEPEMPVGRIPLTSARASGFGGDMLARYGLSVGAITMETAHESAEIMRARLQIEDVVLVRSLRSVEALGIRMIMQAMDIDEARLDFDCSATSDRIRREIAVDSCALNARKLAEVKLTARMTAVDDNFWHGVDDGDAVALLGSEAALASARLVIDDKSLLRRALQAKAMMSGRTASAERAALAAEIRNYQPADILITQEMTTLLDTVARFVERGGALTVAISPQPPLGLEKIDYLLKPGADLLTALGLSATLSR